MSERISQKQSIEQNPLFKKFYTTPASEIVQELGCEYWTQHFINPINWATSFSHIEDSTAACMGMISLPFIVPSYEFIFDFKKIMKGFEQKLNTDSVARIERADNHWKIDTQNGQSFDCNNVILATPLNIAQKLIDITEEVNAERCAYMFHIRGKLKKKYRGGRYIFIDDPGLYMAIEPDKTTLFYAKHKEIKLDTYFDKYEIIATKHWNPGFILGPHAIEADRGNNMYLIGGHTAPTMEDAFTTGIYAANQILKKRK